MSTLVYHFTDASNLPAILESGNVFCKARLPGDARKVDISHYDIQQKRAIKRVKCGPGGVLHDYVPLYFATQSPMMFKISRGGVKGCSSNTGRLVYLVSSVERVREMGLGFVFTDGHAVVAFTRFYDDLVQLDQVDWEVLGLQYWQDTEDDNDRERRKQAEFLIHGSFPWEAVESLAVKDEDMGSRLRKYLSDKWPDKDRPVRVEPSWYF